MPVVTRLLPSRLNATELTARVWAAQGKGPQAAAIIEKLTQEKKIGTMYAARVYEQMGQPAGAEKLYLEALEVVRRARGQGTPIYATNLHGLAWLYKMQGDYARAEELLREALQSVGR